MYDQVYLAEHAVDMSNLTILSFFAKFYYSLELSDALNITLRFKLGAMKLRY